MLDVDVDLDAGEPLSIPEDLSGPFLVCSFGIEHNDVTRCDDPLLSLPAWFFLVQLDGVDA